MTTRNTNTPNPGRQEVKSRSKSKPHSIASVQDIFADLHCARRRAAQATEAKDPNGWTKAATGYIDAVLRLSLVSESKRDSEEGSGKWEKYVRLAARLNMALSGEVSSSWALGEEEKECISLGVSQRCPQARLEDKSESGARDRGEGVSILNGEGRKEGPLSLVVHAQCSGWTKAGNQCKRNVKSQPALSVVVADIERFCHQHRRRVLEPSGFYARKTGQWVEFVDWIPNYLQPDTQAALRVEMEKVKSKSDESGYIYTFEIRDKEIPSKIKFKVGRAVNLVKRVDQWGKQCGSKEQVLRGWYPETGGDDDDTDGRSLMKGRLKGGKKGPCCHRLERLIHLELADLAMGKVYLDPAWPKVETKAMGGGGSPTSKKLHPTSLKEKKKHCGDCGTAHKEIFEFTRVAEGKYKGKEWDIVDTVIKKWGKFVEAYV